jgi:hypothetical protein
MKPYRLSTDGPGQADIVDRATGESVGYVMKDEYGEWMPFVWADGHLSGLTAMSLRSGAMLGRDARYGSDAVEMVWRTARVPTGR